MSSVVAISNMALTNIGAENITALTESSVEARACNQFYNVARKLILSAYPWSFAGKTAALAEIANDKPSDWQKAYNKPNDLLVLRGVRPSYDAAEILDAYAAASETEYGFRRELEGNTIYCDLNPAFGRYTFDLTDPTRFPIMFQIAMSWHLATLIALPITRDVKVRSSSLDAATTFQGKAEMLDAGQEIHHSNPRTEGGDIVEARG